jgi:hydroxypyruvate reductase
MRPIPKPASRKFIQVQDGVVSIAGRPLAFSGRLIVVGTGKASAKMAQVAEEILDGRIAAGLVVTKYDHSLPLQRIQLVEAGHPLPDAAGVGAVELTRAMLRDLKEEDLVLCLISGGGSALWPAPAEGITLEQKQEVTQLLLRAGASIRELNAVRKHLSAIKGGQLARWAAPARVVSLIMSDVIGDPLDFIASGPTAPDTTSFSDAVAIVQKYGVSVPESVSRRLQDGALGRIPDTPKPGDPVFARVENHIIANNRLLVAAALEKARELKFNTLVLSTEAEGEAREDRPVLYCRRARDRTFGKSGTAAACVLAAGETTVTVHGKGAGGRNQEMALAWAIDVAARSPDRPSCFASVATDGSDGPTSAAGGLVDPSTCSRAVEMGLDPSQFLSANDSFNLLKATGDLIVTGPTQTNLMDLQILLVGGI